ncbi:hypothetical protein [Nocardiopsis metallicus]|uniref:Uncharacterized protein n=1 Tax=Nocardiopsis metallicus TaxID=179819 RepID=A0A840WFB7_9ACTN|nr:hypothetical protein [Nocardiopsis metallicus]MBB5495670.1 hypothetical protein [Nocardiopsis metallicus]
MDARDRPPVADGVAGTGHPVGYLSHGCLSHGGAPSENSDGAPLAVPLRAGG